MNIVRQKCSEYVEHEQKELSKSWILERVHLLTPTVTPYTLL